MYDDGMSSHVLMPSMKNEIQALFLGVEEAICTQRYNDTPKHETTS